MFQVNEQPLAVNSLILPPPYGEQTLHTRGPNKVRGKKCQALGTARSSTPEYVRKETQSNTGDTYRRPEYPAAMAPQLPPALLSLFISSPRIHQPPTFNPSFLSFNSCIKLEPAPLHSCISSSSLTRRIASKVCSSAKASVSFPSDANSCFSLAVASSSMRCSLRRSSRSCSLAGSTVRRRL